MLYLLIQVLCLSALVNFASASAVVVSFSAVVVSVLVDSVVVVSSAIASAS